MYTFVRENYFNGTQHTNSKLDTGQNQETFR